MRIYIQTSFTGYNGNGLELHYCESYIKSQDSSMKIKSFPCDKKYDGVFKSQEVKNKDRDWETNWKNLELSGAILQAVNHF